MLLKSRISNIDMSAGYGVNEYWRTVRLAKFTSSNIWKLCSEKGFGETGMSYIRSRVFESLSGIPSETEVNTESTIHGLVEEGSAIYAAINKYGINPKQVVVQKFIYGETDMYGCTPDALYCMNASADDLAWNVEVWEAKCYQAVKHMEMLEIDSPQELRAVNRPVYFQTLDQMLNVDCLTGKAIFFNPALPEDKGRLHIIPFRKMQKDEVNNRYPIVEDLKFLKQRKEMAVAEFNRIKNKICQRN